MHKAFIYHALYPTCMRKRTEDNARLAVMYTDEQFLDAIVDALKTPSVQSVEVADRVGCSTQYAKRRLQDMADRGLIEGKIIGNVWCCRLKKD